MQRRDGSGAPDLFSIPSVPMRGHRIRHVDKMKYLTKNEVKGHVHKRGNKPEQERKNKRHTEGDDDSRERKDTLGTPAIATTAIPHVRACAQYCFGSSEIKSKLCRKTKNESKASPDLTARRQVCPKQGCNTMSGSARVPQTSVGRREGGW